MNSEFSTKELVNECVLGLVCFTYCITFLKMITLKFFTRGNMVILKNNTFLMPGLFYSRILCFDLNSPGKVLLICILRKDWRRDQSISIFVFNLPKTKGNKRYKTLKSSRKVWAREINRQREREEADILLLQDLGFTRW